MTDTHQDRNQEAFLIFKQEIKAALNGVQSNPQFDSLMITYFQQGLTAHEALTEFFKNNNEELEEEILQLTNPK